MDYIVCDAESIEALQRRVNEYRRLAYQVIGGIAVARERISGPLNFYQAVLKDGTEPAPHGWQLSTVAKIQRRRGRPPKIRSETI